MMKFSQYLYLVGLICLIHSCGDSCFQDLSNPRDKKNIVYEIDSTNNGQGKYKIRLDSIYLVYPKILKLEDNGKIPCSYEHNVIEVVFYRNNSTKADTIKFGYDFYNGYSEKCYRYSYGIMPASIISSTFPPKYNIHIK